MLIGRMKAPSSSCRFVVIAGTGSVLKVIQDRWDAFSGRAGQLGGEEVSVLGTRQAVVVTQRLALVFGAEQTTALQDRHDMLDETLEARGQHGRHDVEAVGGAGLPPLLDGVGDLLGCAGEGAVTTPAAEPA